MLELAGFLSVMVLWWVASLHTVLVAAYPLIKKYVQDIGLDNQTTWLQQKYIGPLLGKKNPNKSSVLKYSTTRGSGYKHIFFLIGIIFWGISIILYNGVEDSYIWTASIKISEGLAPYAWWGAILLIYPALVKIGKFLVKANVYLAKINHSEK